MRLLPFALPLLLALTVHAQSTSTIIDRANQGAPGGALPGTRPEAITAAPGADSDAGTQRVADARKLPFTVTGSLDEQFYYTDNVNLAERVFTEAMIVASTTSVRAETLPVVLGEGQLLVSLAANYQRFWHGIGDRANSNLVALDFNNFTLPLNAAFRWGQGWEAAAGLSYNRLYSAAGFNRLYSATSPTLDLHKLTQLSDNLILSTGLGVGYSSTWANVSGPRDDRNDKLDASADASLYVIRGKWVLSPTVRLGYADYLHWEELANTPFDRTDLTLSTGLSLAYNFASWGSARVYTNYDRRMSESSLAGYDYDYAAATVGIGLGLNLRY